MIFNPELYFYGMGERLSDIKEYDFRFSEGILICHKILFYLVLGSYAERCKNFEKNIWLTEDEKNSYITIIRLLKRIKGESKSIPKLYITPHVFTKFIHLLKEKDKPGDHFRIILELIQEDFSYIIEENVGKEELIEFDNFKNTSLGISESALIILRGKKNPPCILSCNPMILKNYDNEFLYINFEDLVSFIKEDIRKNKID